MPVGAAKFGLMAAAGGGDAAFKAFGGIISQWAGAASVITDSSAADNNGTTTGVRYSTAATKSGTYGLHSVDFGDPPRGYVRAPTMSTLGMTTAFTVSCWAKADAHPATWTCLFGQASTSSWGDGFGLYVSGTNTITGFVNSYSSNSVADTVTFTNWNHYVLTYDGSNLKLYINGSLGDTSANTGTIASNTIGIADLHVASDSNSFTWPGVSDEWGFWNEALTAAEITAIYNSGTPLSLSSDSGNYASSANLKAYYKFEDPVTYRVHTFRGSGLTNPKFYVSAGEADVDYLIVAGGGAGGAAGSAKSGGGGGAGGMLTGTGVTVNTTSSPYPITIGAGGTAGVNSGSGSNSVALGVTATGGGYGGVAADGAAGGSGGGGGMGSGDPAESGGAASPAGQGNAGGDSGDTGSASVAAGGGGGGRGAVGADISSNAAGAGGAGATGYGVRAITPHYAGGGGGGLYRNDDSGTAAAGGSGVGGAGAVKNGAPGNKAKGGVPNTGSGSGGATTGNTSADGSAGIVIIRYEVAA